MTTSIDHKEIRGIDFKIIRIVVGGLVGIVITIMASYYSLKASIASGATKTEASINRLESTMLLKDTLSSVRLTALELNLDHLRIEIDLIKAALADRKIIPTYK